MTRIIGAVVRLVILLVGTVFLIVWVAVLVGLFAFWLVAPAVLVVMLGYGITLLIV